MAVWLRACGLGDPRAIPTALGSTRPGESRDRLGRRCGWLHPAGDGRAAGDARRVDQMWLHEHALAPWRYDVVLNPDRDGRWVFRRDPELDYELDEVTWVADDGIRYLTPELTLAYKAKQGRAKDEADLLAALPLLSPVRRTWLADMIDHLHPGHAWIERIRQT